MKLIKKNKILIIIILIFGLFGFFAIFEYVNWWNQYEATVEYKKNECLTTKDKEYLKYCEMIKTSPELKQQDTVNLYFDLLATNSMRFFQIVSPLLVAIAAVYSFHNKLKSGFVKNILSRKSYKSFMIKNIIRSWRYAIIIPIFLLILFGLSFLISGHFNFYDTLKNWDKTPYVSLKHLQNTGLFIFVYISNFILHSIFSINLFYIVTKKSKNFALTIIGFLISYIGIYIVQEVFIGIYLLGKLLKIKQGTAYLNFSSIWNYTYVDNLLISLGVTLLLVAISIFVLIATYKNKEEVLLKNEI